MAGRRSINEKPMTTAERKRRSRAMSKPEINFVTEKCHEMKIRKHQDWRTNEFLENVLKIVTQDYGDETITECRKRIDYAIFLAFSRYNERFY